MEARSASFRDRGRRDFIDGRGYLFRRFLRTGGRDSFASTKYSKEEARNRRDRPMETTGISPLAVRVSRVRNATPRKAAACARLSRCGVACITLHPNVKREAFPRGGGTKSKDYLALGALVFLSAWKARGHALVAVFAEVFPILFGRIGRESFIQRKGQISTVTIEKP